MTIRLFLEIMSISVMLALAVLALSRTRLIQDWAVRSTQRTHVAALREFVASPRYRLVVAFVGVLAALFAVLGVWAVATELLRR